MAVWGSNPYTSDSLLSRAAVHAGVLKTGESGVVQVTILPGLKSYAGSTKNGVTTSGYGPWGSSYRIEKTENKHPVPVAADPLIGRWRWFVDGVQVPGHEFLPGGLVENVSNASWTLVDPKQKRYQFVWGNGKVIDVMTLSPDGKTLSEKNNRNSAIRGDRIDVSATYVL